MSAATDMAANATASRAGSASVSLPNGTAIVPGTGDWSAAGAAAARRATDDGSVEGMIFNVQKFSVHDGEGIRTLVFLKGCPLRCRWCSNPESQSPRAEISWSGRDCLGCGTCAKVCAKGAVTFADDSQTITS